MSRGTWLYRGALAGWTAEFCLLMVWYLWLAPPPAALRAPVLLAVVLPWLLPLRGLLRRRRYTIAWSSLLVLAYFIHGILAAAAPPPERWLGLVETGLAVGYFTCAVMFVRRTRSAPAAQQG